MRKQVFTLIVILLTAPALTGCFALLAGAGGTALWQGGKVISQEAASMEKAVKATEAALKSKNIEVTDKVIKTSVVQLRGKDSADKKVAVDVFDVGDNQTKIEVRYGLVGEETPARDLINAIKRRL